MVVAVALAVSASLAGLCLAVAGWRGVVPRLHRQDSTTPKSESKSLSEWPWARISVAVVAGLAVWWRSGWFVAGIGVSVMVWMVPLFSIAGTRKAAADARAEAIAGWTEMMADTTASGVGLRSALVTTSRLAPSSIRREVQLLATRSESMELGQALRMFAADVADSRADVVVAALLMSHERASGRLHDVLSAAARSAREEVSMQRRVEATRARTYASARVMVVIGVGVLLLLVLFRPPFVAAFDGPVGQLVLAATVGLFVAGVWSLLKMSEPTPPPRVLQGIEAQ